MFLGNHPGMTRRHFFQHMAGFSALTLPSLDFLARLAHAAPQMQREHKSLIILWMSGGPSHMDTWDLKPESSNAGEFKPIKTAASGVEICEHMPETAKQMKHLSIIRSLVSNEGSHERGRVLMHTAYQPNPAVTYPSIGSVLAQQLAPSNLAIPGFISISRPSEGPGFLGMAYAPFTVQNPGAPPQNVSTPLNATDPKQAVRLANRGQMLTYLENSFVKSDRGPAALAHKEIYTKAFDLTYSKSKVVFDLEVDSDGRPMDPKLRDEYGRTPFGNGCLLARKLVEAGVPAIEIDLGGWDNHQNIFTALHNNRPNQGGLVDRLDKGMAALVRDLVDRGLWKNTVICWMGEFGRTPRINQNAGRDHWGRCWSVVVGGGGIKGGQVYGSTDKDGMSVKDNPVSVGDFFATLYEAIGVSPDLEIRDPLGRPSKITGQQGGTPIEALVS